MTSAVGRRWVAIMLLLFIGCWPSAAAHARDSINQAELKAFVTTVQTVETLQRKWAPRLLAAKGGPEYARLRDAARADVATALNRIDGMTRERYDEIRRAAAQDPELMARITAFYRSNKQKQ